MNLPDARSHFGAPTKRVFYPDYGAARAGDEQRASWERARRDCTAAGFDWIQGDCIRRATCTERAK